MKFADMFIAVSAIFFILLAASSGFPHNDFGIEKELSFAEVVRNELIKSLNDDIPKSAAVQPNHKIIGGWSVTTGLVPYQVHISIFKTSGVMQSCGGSLITSRHVLTAAHCLHSMTGAIIVIGASQKDEYFGLGVKTFIVEGKDFIIHPDYDDELILNDIAIVRLPSNVQRSFNIKTIDLPSADQEAVDYFSGKEGLISGFGRTSDDNNDYGSEKLKMAYANITTLKECQQFWASKYHIQESQICTRFNGTGTCQGDSGGPLAVMISNKNVLAGITSFGAARCTKVAPSIYTNVAYFLVWIRRVINLN